MYWHENLTFAKGMILMAEALKELQVQLNEIVEISSQNQVTKNMKSKKYIY